MKNLLTLFSFALIINAHAQTQDLIALANGDFLGMNALYDEKSNLFGYISLYSYGKSGDKTKKFEYIILDKNLNPFANNKFDGDITAANYRGYMKFDGKIILKPTHVDLSLIKKDDAYTPSSMIIDLKENTVQKDVLYEFDHGRFIEKKQNDTWKENRKEVKEERKKNGFVYDASVIAIKEGGYLVFDYEFYKDFTRNCHVMLYDSSKKEIWRYEYGKYNTESDWEYLRFIERDKKHIYGIMSRSVGKGQTKYYLLVIDMLTGKEVHKKEIDAPADVLSHITSLPTYSYGELNNDRAFDDKIVMVTRTTTPFGFYTGFARLMIDKTTFKTDYKTIAYGLDFKPYLPYINSYGQVEKFYNLDPRGIFFMKDGSVGILLEKYKAAGQYNAMKTTDLVYVYTDKDFKIKGAKVLEKDMSRWSNADYLFAQYLNDDNDLVFFYRDFQKDDETKQRNWNLFINTFIGGVFKQEMIPISSKKNFIIFPYVAKEGYILLQEFNKEGKYNQIRLEKLNY